jgi:riboflavin synthase
MFTGIIETTLTIASVRRTAQGLRLAIDVSPLRQMPELGASVAINGVCLTVATLDGSVASFDVVGETCNRTTLGHLAAGGRVNVEPALRMGQPLDGHFVQGHVDGTATVERVETTGGQWRSWFVADQADAIGPYLVVKGSVAIDGVSLTLADVDGVRFSVALIPTTLGLTTLAGLKGGDRVNIETDLIVRAISRQLQWLNGSQGGLTLDALQRAGFA